MGNSNHGTFYYNQLGALKILVNDLPGAKRVTDEYFNTQYLTQVLSNGEQVCIVYKCSSRKFTDKKNKYLAT